MKTTLLAIFIAGMLAASAAAWSQPYLGIALGQTNMKNACEGAPGSISCDDKGSAFKLFGGHQFNRHLAVEFGFSDLGTAKASTGETADLSAMELVGIGSWPLATRFAVYGKLGVYRGEMDAKDVPVPVVGPPFSPPPRRGWRSGGNTDVTFGIGASFDLTSNAAMRVEWQRYADLGGSGGPKLDLDVLSLGALLRF